VIYLDTSAALAELLAEDIKPAAGLWSERLVSSRLLEYEIWTRLHARKLARTHGEAARDLLARVALLELVPPVLDRALEPFPTAVRTLDALHLASIDFLRARRVDVRLATFDARMREAAIHMGVKLFG
jgi:predicted nucleic acid-binding protein